MCKIKTRFNSAFITAFWIWLAVTILVASSVGLIYQRLGMAGFEVFLRTGPYSILSVTMVSVTLTWLLAGIYLFLFGSGCLGSNNVFKHAGFLLVAFMYLNVMRERIRYGDIDYYIKAAKSLLKDQPLPTTYFYPPLWATILKYMVVYGDDFILTFVWTLNILALFAFYFLLQRVLEKYGFAPRMATLITTVFMLVNTTILRTLGYMQVNLLMLDFIFLGLLLFQRSSFWSALCMALAVYLKASPAVLVLAFFLELDWRWMAWAAFHMLWLTALLLWLDGTQPFLDFFHNYVLLTSPHTSVYHDNSFDSFLLAISEFTNLSSQLAMYMAHAAKGIVGIIILLNIPRVIKNKTFYPCDDNTRLYNSLPLLAILMVLATPLIWEHHGIVLALPFLLLLKRLDTPSEWSWFGFAYLLQYIVPTFDFFPWSYGRLFAPLILLWLVLRSAKESSQFARWNQWLDNIPLMQTR
jgi:hypothetical protein